MNSSPPQEAMQFASSFDSSDAPNLGLDQGEFYPNPNSCNNLGSPCFSIHTRSTKDPKLIMGEDNNSKKVLGEFCTEKDASQLSKNRSIKGISKDKELIDDQSSLVSLDSYVDSITNKGEVFHYDYEFDEGPKFSNLDNVKNIRKKKKRKNYWWSKKKIHSKVKVKDPDPPKFTIEDTCISNSLCREEAIKTLEVSKLISISFAEEDKIILQKFMELKLEEWETHNHF